MSRVRSYFIPSHIGTYWKLIHRPELSISGTGQKFAFFDFTRVEIDHVSGRYLFALVREFEALGLMICYRKNFRFLATMRHKTHKRLLLDRPFRLCRSIDELPAESVAVEVTDRRATRSMPGRKQIQLRYDAGWPHSEDEVPMPFFVHPLLYDQWLACAAPDLAGLREWRVFFAGKRACREYRSGTLPVRFGKMSRSEILETLDETLPRKQVHRVETAADVAPGAVSEPCFVWADSARYRIRRTEWLSTLDRADFFLACPGMDMPLCHNLVEAISRGAVPILEHPEYLDPPLEHEVNCMVFRGRQELIATVERAFRLDRSHIARLRRGAYAYYQDHLAPGRFARRLLQSPRQRCTVLLNAYRAPKHAVRL